MMVADFCVIQWISEVLHFCQGLPILLVACKKDLRNDPHTIEELRKTSQRPVTYEEVQFAFLFKEKDHVQGLTHNNVIGYGCVSEDWCLQILGMFGKGW